MSTSQPSATAARTTADFRLEGQARSDSRAYVRHRDRDRFTVVMLDPAAAPIYLGRHPSSTVHVAEDPHVSGRHARLLFGAGCWSIEDAGSRNGTLLNGRPVTTELRLSDGALIEVGASKLSFHDPTGAALGGTLAADSDVLRGIVIPTPTQRRVLVELARPWFASDVVVPVAPSNAEIAAALSYQPATVRDVISDLYRRAGLVRGESQRQALVDLAIRARIVKPDDYV